MHGHFRLDLEAGGDRKTLHIAARKSTVAGEDVGEVVAEQHAVKLVEQPVAEGVAVAAGIVVNAAAGADDHVGPFGDQRANEFLSVRRT